MAQPAVIIICICVQITFDFIRNQRQSIFFVLKTRWIRIEDNDCGIWHLLFFNPFRVG